MFQIFPNHSKFFQPFSNFFGALSKLSRAVPRFSKLLPNRTPRLGERRELDLRPGAEFWMISAAPSAPNRPQVVMWASRASPARKPAANMSPAPVVSTSFAIGKAGTSQVSIAVDHDAALLRAGDDFERASGAHTRSSTRGEHRRGGKAGEAASAGLQALLPALEPSKGEQDERYDKRNDPVPMMDVIAARLEPWEKRGKAAGWDEPVHGGGDEEHNAKQSGDQRQRSAHDSRCTRGPRRCQAVAGPVPVGDSTMATKASHGPVTRYGGAP